MALGQTQTKDLEIEFVNRTDLTLIIPAEGHRVKNPGSLEGWNDMEIGGTIARLKPGESRSTRQTVSIKPVDDAQFEIHYSAAGGRDFTQVFSDVDIRDKVAVLRLTHH
jgi:hypothetical protein